MHEIFNHEIAFFNLPIFEAVCDELSFGHVVEPVEFPSGMLSSVECGEPVNAAFKLCRKREHAGLLERPRTRRENLK